MSFALLPYIVFGEFDHGRKFYQAILAILIWLALFITLIVLFYSPDPLYLEGAHVFTCIPPLGETDSEYIQGRTFKIPPSKIQYPHVEIPPHFLQSPPF